MNNDEYRMSVSIENGEVEKLKQDSRNYMHEVEALKARIVWLECEAQAQQSAPAGYVMVPVEMIDSFPEINPNNYSHDQVCDLDAWGCDLVRAAIAAAPKAECTNSDSWNCKYCNKTKDCEALKDPRNFAAPKAEQPPAQEPVGWYTEDHLTDKSATTYDKSVADRWRAKGWPVHPLYKTPQPVSDDAKDALVEGLETIALESTDEQARCCAHHYLATYRAAQEKK